MNEPTTGFYDIRCDFNSKAKQPLNLYYDLSVKLKNVKSWATKWADVIWWQYMISMLQVRKTKKKSINLYVIIMSSWPVNDYICSPGLLVFTLNMIYRTCLPVCGMVCLHLTADCQRDIWDINING